MISFRLFIGGIFVMEVIVVEKRALGVTVFLIADRVCDEVISSFILRVPGEDFIVCFRVELCTLPFWVSLHSVLLRREMFFLRLNLYLVYRQNSNGSFSSEQPFATK